MNQGQSGRKAGWLISIMRYDYKYEWSVKAKKMLYNVYEYGQEVPKLITGFTSEELARRYTQRLATKRRGQGISAFKKLTGEIALLSKPIEGLGMKIVARRTEDYVQGSVVKETAILESRAKPDPMAVARLVGRDPQGYGCMDAKVKWLAPARWQVDWSRQSSAG